MTKIKVNIDKDTHLSSYSPFTPESLQLIIDNFIEENPEWEGGEFHFQAETSIGYYDSIDLEIKLVGSRLETDGEYAERMEKDRLKREKDAENALKSKERAALLKEQKDLEEYKRLTKKFKGTEIDTTSI